MDDLDWQLELVGLMCSRICHDLVSPVGAIANGIEVLTEEDDPEMRDQAIAHIAHSAERASQRLQFLRLALGSGGGPGARMALDQAGEVARALFGAGRHSLDWQVPAITVDRQAGRLLLNLLMVGEESLPKGGRIEAVLEEVGPSIAVRLTAAGAGARLPAEWDLDAVLRNGLADLTPRGAQICHALLLARAMGVTLRTDLSSPDRIEIATEIPFGAGDR